MIDPFIEKLVGDLKPKKPLANRMLWMHCTGCLVMIAALILGLIGLRGDYINAMQTGAMFWKPSIFFFIWFGSILMITDLSRPGSSLKKQHIIPVLIGFLILLWQITSQISEYSFQAMIQSLNAKSAITCILIILVGGAMVMGMTWKFWLSKTASDRPMFLGFLAGLSSSTLVATAYALNCDKDSVLYIFVYYIFSILTLSLVGSILGKKFLQW